MMGSFVFDCFDGHVSCMIPSLRSTKYLLFANNWVRHENVTKVRDGRWPARYVGTYNSKFVRYYVPI